MATLEELQSAYAEAFGKPAAARYKNDEAWLLKKLQEVLEEELPEAPADPVVDVVVEKPVIGVPPYSILEVREKPYGARPGKKQYIVIANLPQLGQRNGKQDQILPAERWQNVRRYNEDRVFTTRHSAEMYVKGLTA